MKSQTVPGASVEPVVRGGVQTGRWRGRAWDAHRRRWCQGTGEHAGSKAFDRVEQAMAWAEWRVQQCDEDYASISGVPVARQRPRRTWEQYAGVWLSLYEGSPNTVATKSCHIRAWTRMLGPGTYLDQITPDRIRACMRQMGPGGEDLFQTTRAKRLAVLRQVLQAARRDKEITEDPTLDITGPKEKGRRHAAQVITDEQALAAAAHMPANLGEAAVLLAYDSGLREGEISALRRENIHLDAEFPFVSVVATRYPSGKIGPPKGGESREVALSPRTVTALREHFARHPCTPQAFVFRNSRANPVCVQDVRKHWKRAREAAGLGKVHFHHLRHSFVTHLVESGAPPDVAQRAAGHASLATTQRYILAAQLADQHRWVAYSAGSGDRPADRRGAEVDRAV